LYAWEWQAKTGMNGDQETAAVAEPLTYLGSKIREARHSRGLTLKDLAGKVGLTASHISQIERGLTGPSVSAFWNIATALDVPMEYFFNHEGDQLAVAQSTVSAHTMLSSRQSGVPPSGQGPSPEAVEASRRGRTNGNQASPVVLPRSRETINIVGGIQWQKLTILPMRTVGANSVECCRVPYWSSWGSRDIRCSREIPSLLTVASLTGSSMSAMSLSLGSG
jgi:transcriptional regulator with XRE-family HTH domain